MPVVETIGAIFGAILASIPKVAVGAGAKGGVLAKITGITEQVRLGVARGPRLDSFLVASR